MHQRCQWGLCVGARRPTAAVSQFEICVLITQDMDKMHDLILRAKTTMRTGRVAGLAALQGQIGEKGFNADALPLVPDGPVCDTRSGHAVPSTRIVRLGGDPEAGSAPETHILADRDVSEVQSDTDYHWDRGTSANDGLCGESSMLVTGSRKRAKITHFGADSEDSTTDSNAGLSSDASVSQSDSSAGPAGPGKPTPTGTPSNTPDQFLGRLHKRRPCYICKAPYEDVHAFYDRMCPGITTSAVLPMTRDVLMKSCCQSHSTGLQVATS